MLKRSAPTLPVARFGKSVKSLNEAAKNIMETTGMGGGFAPRTPKTDPRSVSGSRKGTFSKPRGNVSQGSDWQAGMRNYVGGAGLAKAIAGAANVAGSIPGVDALLNLGVQGAGAVYGLDTLVGGISDVISGKSRSSTPTTRTRF